MKSKPDVLFIVNPFSGLGKQHTIDKLIQKEIDSTKWNCQVAFTEYQGHATKLSSDAVGRFELVVAVGGDGTVNEVGSGLVGTDTILGIVPAGSGNGLARYLNIPLKVNRALQMLNYYEVKSIDVLKVNDRYSFNVSGIGFDAHISHLFAHEPRRGPMGYMKLLTREFSKYKSKVYRIEIDGKTYEREAFLISFANSSQYGNNVHIAPGAKIDDGLIDICVIRDFPKYSAPALLISLLDQSIDQSKYDEIILGRNIVISDTTDVFMHLDGEPVTFNDTINVQILPLAIKMALPTSEFLQNSILNQIQDLVPGISSFTKKKG